MKGYNIKGLLLVLTIAIGFSSCSNVLDVNTDPNNASTATPQLILPSAQSQVAAALGFSWNYTGCMWAQYWTGGYGVSTTQLEYYNQTGVDTDGGWTRAYARALADIRFLEKSGQPIYAGMGKILSAYMFQMLVDLHGDVPFSEAAKGEIADGGITTPKFDSEEDIYAALIPLVDEGIADITSGEGVAPSDDDLMYGGKIASWVKFANTIKLKVLIRKGDYTAANALVDAGTPFISSPADEAKFNYYETAQNTNPMYARFEARTTVGMYYVAAHASVQALQDLNDPRSTTIYDIGNAGHEGVFSGDINDNSALYPSGGSNNRFDQPSDYTYGATVPVFFISSWESKFLQGEAVLRTGGDAATLLEEGIQESFNYYELGSAAAYAATLGYGAADLDGKLNILAVQKWISMNGLQMAEGWLETVRFDRPGNAVFKGGIFTSPINNALGDNNFPSSFVIPAQETSYNPGNAPTNVTVQTTRFWDN